MSTDHSWSPAVSSKTTATTLAGALVTLLVWAAQLGGVDVPAEVAAAAVTLIMGLAAYALPVRTRGRYER